MSVGEEIEFLKLSLEALNILVTEHGSAILVGVLPGGLIGSVVGPVALFSLAERMWR